MRRFAIFLGAAALALAAPAWAQPVKIVVPFAAGGPIDQLARILAQDLAPQLQTEVIVENRSGAGGAIGTEAAARSAPDGKTILLGSLGSHVINSTLTQSRNYDPIASFSPIMLVGSVPTLLVAGPKSGVSTFNELIAKAKQGVSMNYGSSGGGSTMNIAVEMLNAVAGVKIAHVPYRGGGPAINDLLGGHVDIVNADFPLLLPHVRAGNLKALAQYAGERSPLLPDVPTTRELGFPDVVLESWYGAFVPAATPPDIRDRLERALTMVIETPAVKEKLAASGMRNPLTGAAFRERLPKDVAYWKETLTRLNIKAE